MALHDHCSYCGAAYPQGAPWPRTCTSCGETTWRNPLPVAVVLLPVDTDEGRGIVVVRRDIEPMRGELALPGGFIELGETWQEAAARELREETTIPADPAEVRLFDVQSVRSGNLIVFGVLPPRPYNTLPASVPTDESLGFEIAVGPRPLCFPTHTDMLAAYFAAP
ncbi:NUDIX domain-containing protein [Dactylosporangium vinaceum]|uniref:NUDIX domain-containing protein n=1 Tax=Dactylosporangium vinaceum TaxID=53362 RepID=A0ABV5MBQ4_9ACTN|nr:NUDIX domain-containing protein [Dactylosporangium vinaceum]UAB98503.1 NUDIX domain-containing protein [Dactylosporangium vinaceum]